MSLSLRICGCGFSISFDVQYLTQKTLCLCLVMLRDFVVLNVDAFLVSGCNLLNLRRTAGDIPLKCVRGTCVRAVAVWRRVLVSEPPSNKTEAWSELLSYDGSASRQNIPASAAARSVHCPLSTVSTMSTVSTVSTTRRG